MRAIANLTWSSVAVIVGNDSRELFERSQPDNDLGQEPAFLVTANGRGLAGSYGAKSLFWVDLDRGGYSCRHSLRERKQIVDFCLYLDRSCG